MDETTQLYKQHHELCDVIHSTYMQKNAAYGNSFSNTYKKLGIVSAVTRITDKYNRLVALATNSELDHGDEKITDTLLDMANYCLMTVMEIENNESN